MWRESTLWLFGLLIVGLWVVTRLVLPSGEQVGMPDKVTAEEERALYLTPGGVYTQQDIDANDGQTPSERFRGFRSQHDFNPQPGDVICPITRTVAHPGCTWIIAGEQYAFCCPPCIDEFVRLAKEEPEAIQPPKAYVK